MAVQSEGQPFHWCLTQLSNMTSSQEGLPFSTDWIFTGNPQRVKTWTLSQRDVLAYCRFVCKKRHAVRANWIVVDHISKRVPVQWFQPMNTVKMVMQLSKRLKLFSTDITSENCISWSGISLSSGVCIDQNQSCLSHHWALVHPFETLMAKPAR